MTTSLGLGTLRRGTLRSTDLVYTASMEIRNAPEEVVIDHVNMKGTSQRRDARDRLSFKYGTFAR